ncbi:MAG: D-glycero-beta-D-manno-heptose 1,7-bisphosphate 7-phosphatase [Gammaproteobacteria bacterium]|nr:D-glycero-beta-D-manno-heptose 1,7-bisphosphate 7-phosphatase [Gammaproteobacteria bacterium]
MKLLIMDRDGVINEESEEFIKSPDEWHPIKGSLEAIARLSQAGYDVVIITNQSGVGRGLLTADTLADIHVRMIDLIRQQGGKVQSILFCPHLPEDDCDCRKPKTGLYEELAERLSITFNGVYSVGDSVRDLTAAQRAGATPVLVKTGNGKKSAKEIANDKKLGLSDTMIYESLAKFADALLTQEG